MVITPATVLPGPQLDFELVARLHRILASSTRLRVLSALESRSLSFTDLMRALGLNPKTLSTGLSLMSESGLVRKSYPHHVYVITPLGRRILREQVLTLWESLQLTGGLERRPT
jgi:DNA-binding HxlR family transcriptional regulator